jgi:cGMP-dependent protein kinase
MFKQNDQGSCFFIIHEGVVEVEINGEIKKQLKPGDSFGELALMYNAPRSASIRAQTTTRFWAIDRRTFKKVVEEVAISKFKENREYLEKVSFFESMTESQKDAVAMVLLTQNFKPGQNIINEGDAASSYYIIKEVECLSYFRARLIA